MKAKYIAVILPLLVLVVASVQAPWDSLSSGYAIWTNYHGVEVPLWTDVTATAGTTEYPGSSAHLDFPDVTHVRFRWMRPSGSGLPDLFSPPLTDPPIPLAWDGSTYYDGWPVYTADDTQTLGVVGDWGIQAWFYNVEEEYIEDTPVEKKRAISGHSVPEIPIAGAAGATVLMFLALGLYWQRRKGHPLNSPSIAN